MLSDWPVGTKRIFIILTTVTPLCLLHLLLSGAIVTLVDFPGTLPTFPLSFLPLSFCSDFNYIAILTILYLVIFLKDFLSLHSIY